MENIEAKMLVLRHATKALAVIRHNITLVGMEEHNFCQELMKSVSIGEILFLRYYYELGLDNGLINPTIIEDIDEQDEIM